MLRLEAVSKTFQPPSGPRVALDNVSLEVARGQIVGIFGPSGSGKTTLLRIAAGLLTPDSGKVFYDGEPLERMSGAERQRFRRREVACIWGTEPLSDGLGVLDYVAMPLLVDRRDHRVAERRAHEALLVCEAEHCLGMALAELSDGERQRVAIARGLVSEPKLLLADSPASRLSLVEQEQIMALLASLANEAKVAVLVTDSNAEALIRADPILYLRSGRLVNQESPVDRGRLYQFPPLPRAAGDA